MAIDVHVKFDGDLAERVDEAARTLSERGGGVPVSRSAAVRALIEMGIRQLGVEKPKRAK